MGNWEGFKVFVIYDMFKFTFFIYKQVYWKMEINLIDKVNMNSEPSLAFKFAIWL